jgi:hypothetical protein
LSILALLPALLSLACAQESSQQAPAAEKIGFDLARLNEQGLQGPPDGLRALSYEFCIPADSAYAAEVQRIDPTLTLYPNSPGRIGCGDDAYLCVGSTHQPGFADVLHRLAALPYVARIEEAFFE